MPFDVIQMCFCQCQPSTWPERNTINRQPQLRGGLNEHKHTDIHRLLIYFPIFTNRLASDRNVVESKNALCLPPYLLPPPSSAIASPTLFPLNPSPCPISTWWYDFQSCTSLMSHFLVFPELEEQGWRGTLHIHYRWYNLWWSSELSRSAIWSRLPGCVT